jgi:DNA-binding transcriptional LysR family regulator
MDRFSEMQAFTAVVDAGSFVGAADALGVSKAAVSRHVANLERRLGARLLHRTTRRLSLTGEGEIFHARAIELLAELDEAEAEIGERGGAAIGRVKINAPVTFGILHLAACWSAFQARHPQVTLDVTLADRVVDLVDEGYDVAVRIARLPSSTLVARKLSSTRMVLCASPDYLARAGRLRHPRELEHHRVLAYRYFAGGDAWPFEGPDGPVTATVRPCLRTNNGETCRVGALHHDGIVLQPSFLVGPDLAAGTLVEVLPEYRSIELGIYALYPTRRHVAPKVRLLVDFLAESFRTPPWEGL